MDPFATYRPPVFHCGNESQNNRSDCHLNSFNFKALCQWSNDTNCTAAPIDSDVNGECGELDTEDECTYHTFTVSGSCFWHEEGVNVVDRAPSSPRWCESIGLDFKGESAWSGYRHLTCKDAVGLGDLLGLSREDMLKSVNAGLVTVIDEKCCNVPAPHPSSVPGHFNFPTKAPTKVPTAMPKQDYPEGTTVVGGVLEDSDDRGSTIILVASAPFVFALVSYMWKNRRKIFSSRVQGDKQRILTDPSQCDHVAPSELERQDEAQFEHRLPPALESTDLVALAPFVFGLVSYLWVHQNRIFSTNHQDTEQILDDPAQFNHHVVSSELEPGSAQFGLGLPPGMDPSQYEIVEP